MAWNSRSMDDVNRGGMVETSLMGKMASCSPCDVTSQSQREVETRTSGRITLTCKNRTGCLIVANISGVSEGFCTSVNERLAWRASTFESTSGEVAYVVQWSGVLICTR